MRKATKMVAMWLGMVAGIAGLEHGYFEVLQGNTKPSSLAFPSWGPPCMPEEIWHRCEPAMSIVPNFLITDILAMLLSLALIAWAGWFLQRRHGGRVQMAISILLLLFGGGFFPPMLALVGGLAGTQINRPLSGQSGSFTRFTAKLWPWSLILLIVWLPAQFLLGDLLKALGVFGLLPIFILLPLSVYAAYAHDATSQA